jgi:hypothetical protein
MLPLKASLGLAGPIRIELSPRNESFSRCHIGCPHTVLYAAGALARSPGGPLGPIPVDRSLACRKRRASGRLNKLPVAHFAAVARIRAVARPVTRPGGHPGTAQAVALAPSRPIRKTAVDREQLCMTNGNGITARHWLKTRLRSVIRTWASLRTH